MKMLMKKKKGLPELMTALATKLQKSLTGNAHTNVPGVMLHVTTTGTRATNN
jgi:hypothetical protein